MSRVSQSLVCIVDPENNVIGHGILIGRKHLLVSSITSKAVENAAKGTTALSLQCQEKNVSLAAKSIPSSPGSGNAKRHKRSAVRVLSLNQDIEGLEKAHFNVSQQQYNSPMTLLRANVSHQSFAPILVFMSAETGANPIRLECRGVEVDDSFLGCPITHKNLDLMLGIVIGIHPPKSVSILWAHDVIVLLRDLHPDIIDFGNSEKKDIGDGNSSETEIPTSVMPRFDPDIPAEAKQDSLGYSAFAGTLADFIRNTDKQPAPESQKRPAPESQKKPLCIGIDGSWGTGKTTLMRFIKADLERADRQDPNIKGLTVGYPTLWFDAWKYDKEESLWAALIEQIEKKIKTEFHGIVGIKLQWKLRLKQLRRIHWSLFFWSLLFFGILLSILLRFWGNIHLPNEPHKPFSWLEFTGGLAILKTIWDLLKSGSEWWQKEVHPHTPLGRYRPRLGIIREFSDDLVEYVNLVSKELEKPIVIFVDDLDRCSGNKVSDLVTAISALCSTSNCIFVIGLDTRAVAASIEETLARGARVLSADEGGRSRGELYLEKILQVQFHIPQPGAASIERYIEANCPEVTKAKLPVLFKTFMQAAELLDYNPRQIKRFINHFRLMGDLSRASGLIEDLRSWQCVAQSLVLAMRWPDLVSGLRGNRQFLTELRKTYELQLRIEEAQRDQDEAAQIEIYKAELNLCVADEAIKRLANSKALREMLLSDIIPEEDIDFVGELVLNTGLWMRSKP